MRNTWLAALGVVLTVTLGACAGGDSKDEATATPAKATASVAVKDFAFGPKSISVKTGGTVTWTNQDSFDHSVQIDSLDFDGPKFGPQTMPATFSHRFTKAGTYAYICGVHNSMTGTVVVTN